jgi:hypothetical protein
MKALQWLSQPGLGHTRTIVGAMLRFKQHLRGVSGANKLGADPDETRTKG